MKKLLLTGTLIFFGMATFFTSCKDKNGCTCVLKYDDGQYGGEWTYDDMQEYYNVEKCSDLESAMMRGVGGGAGYEDLNWVRCTPR